MKAEKFDVEIRGSSYRESEFGISITHNGYQWFTTNMDIEEWPEVVAAVEKYLAERSGKKTDVG